MLRYWDMRRLVVIEREHTLNPAVNPVIIKTIILQAIVTVTILLVPGLVRGSIREVGVEVTMV